MSSKTYECSFCGKVFDYEMDRDRHEETCGMKSLDEFADLDQPGTTNLGVDNEGREF